MHFIPIHITIVVLYNNYIIKYINIIVYNSHNYNLQFIYADTNF